MEENSRFVGTAEVSMVESEIVARIKALQEAGWGSRRIADDVGVSRNAVKRYLRGQARHCGSPGTQEARLRRQ